jgi:pyruvate dehydrogenase E2 component (dihydrolipoamide acetyltransferase)
MNLENMEKTAEKKTLPLTRIQKLIGKLMLRSKQRQPCCYLECSVDVTELAKARRSYSKAVGVRITTNDFFLCAIARAVKKFPLMSARLDNTGRNIQTAEKVGLGLAVAAPQGLVVPVIPDTIDKPLSRIAAESAELLKKARANKLMPCDFDGANIVLSSLGMYGVTSFFAIPPPGATAIISIGRITEQVIPVNAEKTIRKTMSAALAVDQTIVDEFYAAKFMQLLVSLLENPVELTD